MTYIHDLPESKGVENGLKRALQMTDIHWTPIRYMAGIASFEILGENGEFERQYAPIYHPPYKPNVGMVYSSVLKNQKFLGYNVSLETYMTALTDPASVLYRKNLHGSGRPNVGCWYGIVCSCFASYVHDLPSRTICRDWPSLEGVTMLGRPDPDDLKLLDIVLNTKKHIAVVTDILRDENGKAQLIEISEAVLPQCKRSYFTPDAFRGYWYGKEFDVYRKSGTEKISYEPSPFVKLPAYPERGLPADPELPKYLYNRDIMPDQGNASNYSAGDEIFVDLLSEGWEKIRVEKDDGSAALYDVKEGKAEVTEKSPGRYLAKALKADGSESAPVEWAVTGICLQTDKEIYAPGETIRLRFDGQGDADVFQFNVNRVFKSGECLRGFPGEEEKKACVFELKAPENADDYFAYVSARNEYGTYVSDYAYFRVEG